ncbi:hypothetical protein [Arabiibacter massiliensis]|uniref:hypothetical protein n=1 Tax=Arabiibacter massiliensis TaxID=1870985 RepID=UPI0009B9A034|nr:hypothetical protein [Arabiibacter massiliensis]
MADALAGQADVAARVFDAVAQIVAGIPEAKGCAYEHAPANAADLPCVVMRTLDGGPRERRYLDGSCVRRYRFALMLRAPAPDGPASLDARALLERIAQAVEQAALDLGAGRASWGAHPDTLPCGIALGEGFADWQVEFTLRYKTN